MNKPGGYDETPVSGEYTPAEVGGHYCVIKQVSERKSSTGKDMIVVLIDFCAPDKQKDYFMESFKNDVREDKKWPFAGSKYIMVNDYQDPSKTSRQFKTFCSCVEKSNNYEVKWDAGDAWGKQFIGKKIGAVYGLEENEYNGRTFMRSTLKWFCNVDAVKDAKVPEPKYIDRNRIATTPPASRPDANGFINVPEGTEEDIPF